MKKLFADDYKTSWLKAHENFLDGYLQILVDAARPITTKILEVAHQECSNSVPQIGNSYTPLVIPSEKYKGKGPQLLKKTPTGQVYDQDCRGGKGSFPLSIAAHVSKKRSSQGEINSSHEDRCWKKVRPRSDKSGDADLAMVEIHDSVDSPSRTLTILIKESLSTGKTEKEATSAPRDRVKARLNSDSQKHPTTAVSVFDGKKSFFEFVATYDQSRLALHDKDMEAARKELSIIAGERLSNAMLEEHEKIEKVSSICQSLSKVKEKIEKLRRKEKDLEILVATTEKEVEEAKLGVSTAKKDFDACNDVDLLNFDDLTDLEQKKELLEAMRQDLINYKLCLD
ncbi:hypothetical protein HAX54_027769 [Datura stramonium]|uniref:Uncharacterized protein n=1 Tax=Datura stramonium TaxID=4076 RepID=A0ABS8S8Z5_DATST|nr:hypothetical protein [Datura stramonium]